MHEPLRQRIAVQYHLEGLSREELDAYLTHQLRAFGITQPLFDDTARQALYQATKGVLRKVNKLALTGAAPGRGALFAMRIRAASARHAVWTAVMFATTPKLLAGKNDTSTKSPSFSTALREQLGLVLQPTKAPVDIFVIDHADPPSEN